MAGCAVKKTILLLPMVLLAAALSSCSGTATPAASAASGISCTYTAAGDAAEPVELPPATGVADAGTGTYTLQLNDKELVLNLDRGQAPCTVNSFISLARQGYFDGTSCHRLTDSGQLYVLQCGDPTGTGSGGPGYEFTDELSGNETYPAGTLAMANAGAGTNGSQFFIVYRDSMLSPDYTVFGHTDGAGNEVVEKIASGGQDESFGQSGGGKPLLPAVIRGVVAG